MKINAIRLMLAFCVILAAVQAFACAAITKKGTQCKRAPSPGSQYCWQHGGSARTQQTSHASERPSVVQRQSVPVQQYQVPAKNQQGNYELPPPRNLTDAEWTAVRLAAIDKAIAEYRERANGAVPMSLQTLRHVSSPSLSFKDGWGGKMRYGTNGIDYVLVSGGEDKMFGTGDDVYSKGSTSNLVVEIVNK